MACPQHADAKTNPAPLPDPLDANDAPPLGQYCDLVLQGGVVDGVIYPGVLIELARRFRFQSLAGTSVGAIAAALAAACEFSRRLGSNRGFDEVLRKIPEELAKPSPDGRGQTVIRSLFQTEKNLQRLFDFLVDVVSVAPDQWLGHIPRATLKHYWPALGAGLALGLILAFFAIVGGPELWHGRVPDTAFSWFLLGMQFVLATLLGLLASLCWLVFTWKHELRILVAKPGFGFCFGRSADGGKTDGLIDWLHQGIQGACGLPLHRPLTFQDLWNAPLGPPGEPGQSPPKSIDLRMMTSCVSHGRPYQLPLEDRSVRLFFKLEEWEPYFPPAVIDYLHLNSRKYTQDSVEYRQGAPNIAVSPSPSDPENTGDFRELPRGKLPILVAVRLSMNFPLLFRAVPAYAIDHEAWNPRITPQPSFKKVWFADGGVTSNFPLHIFDSPIPGWPTFGVYLAERSRKQGRECELFHVTPNHESGRSERWTLIGLGQKAAALAPQTWRGFFDYALGLARMAKDWADNANLRMPGVRDRVVTVYKQDLTAGGLNLNIAPEAIRDLAYRNGTQAGAALAKKFCDGSPKFNQPLAGSAAWMDHRWVRFNAYLTALKTHLSGVAGSAYHPFASSSLTTQIEQAKIGPALQSRHEYEATLTAVQAKALHDAIAALAALETKLAADKVVQPYEARPQPELKTYPRL